MYHPASRLLTILELLQTHPSLSGAALARRLEVAPRSVRRYITMLQDMGMPIEAVRGPGGGYQLRPGFKLPPLMFTEEEATALVLGLLGTAWLAIGQSAVAVEGALAKVLRVLPIQTRERLDAVAAHLTLDAEASGGQPSAAWLLELSEAIQTRRRIRIAYRSYHDQASERTVEPYGVVGWWGRWYLVAFCRLRQDYRSFRLDRVQRLEVGLETFTRAEGFDAQAYMATQSGGAAAPVTIVVTFAAPLYTVQQHIPAGYGTLTETPGGVLFESVYSDLADVARFLATRPLPFVVHEPAALRSELLRIAERLTRSATAQDGAGGS